jgi:hypothetical protein
MIAFDKPFDAEESVTEPRNASPRWKMLKAL